MNAPHPGARLRSVFHALKVRGRPAIIPFVMAGDPDAATSQAILNALPEAGADIVELGIPFSDPMADGPDIQAADERALANGMSLRGVFELARGFRQAHPHVPLVLMGYYNPILQFGLEAFAETCAQTGVDGVIVVDLPPEEQHGLHPFLAARGVAFIRLIAPTTGEARLRRLLADADGFVYTIAVKGITGGASSDTETLAARIAMIRQHTALPVVAGFGIRSAHQATALQGIADGVVVGSALVKAIHEAGPSHAAEAAQAFVRALSINLK